jgi:hypothetical protein
MNWPEFWQVVVSTVVVVAAVAWVAKSLGTALINRSAETHRVALQRDIAGYRAQLQSASESELAQLRTVLETAVREQGLHRSAVHGRQAEVIAELFAGLERLHLALRHFVALIKPEEVDMKDLADRAWEAYSELQAYYYEHAIWLERDTCDAMNVVLGILYDCFVDMTADGDEAGHPQDHEVMKGVLDKVNTEIPRARVELIRKFRARLGIEGPAITLPEIPPRALG